MNLRVSDFYITAPLYEPPFFSNREFGFFIGEEMVRYLQFSTVERLRAYCIQHAPLHVYYSAAKYEYPELHDRRERLEGWLGSDLLFDIDNDHPRTMTLRQAKNQATKLISILQHDFGLKDITLVFSGKRGYHIHVRDESIQTLENPERREIADYFQEFYPGTEERDEKGKKVPDSKRMNPNYVSIDTQVTSDLTRLIRLPGSLHGGSMEPCKIIELSKIRIQQAPKEKVSEKKRMKKEKYYEWRDIPQEQVRVRERYER